MTEAEREEAEQLAAEYAEQECDQAEFAIAIKDFLKGYAAACEAKRAEIEDIKCIAGLRKIEADQFDQTSKAVEAERARSQKVFEAFKKYRELVMHADYTDEDLFEQAIAEYEASRD